MDKGLQTEAFILSRLVERGYRVLTPFGSNQRYDVVIECNGRFLRGQCKRGRLRNGCVVFAAKSVRSSMTACYVRDYRGEIDFFLVHCPANDGLYVVPIEDATTSIGTLRIDAPVNSQGKRIRWAKDYELPG